MASPKSDAEDRAGKLKKAKDLINRSSSPNREEALEAALMACRLIRKYRFDLLDPEDLNALYAEVHKDRRALEEAKAAALTKATDDDDPDSWTHVSAVFATMPSILAPTPLRNPVPAYTPPFTRAPAAPLRPPPPVQPFFMASARFAGKCRQCRAEIPVGAPALCIKGPGGGIWCPAPAACWPDWERTMAAKPGGPVPGFTPMVP